MAVIETGAVRVQEGVAFGRAGDRELLCDIYRPTADVESKRTVVVQFPGGGFRRANRSGTRLARPLAARGYTCVSAEYRVLPDGIWPAALHDAKAAVRWARAHAGELDVEPDKLVVLGYSAGARLSLMLAATPNDPTFEGDSGSPSAGTQIAACVAFYPPFNDLGRHPVAGPEPSEAQLRSLALGSKLTAGYAPTLLFHGTADQTIPVEDSVKLYSVLRGLGVAVELHLVDGVTHIFDAHEDLARASAEWVDLFVDRHVVHPRVYPSTEPAASPTPPRTDSLES